MTPTSVFRSTTIPVLEQVLRFAQARHNVLAGNIANIDTPGYRTRDLSPALFQARLREALREPTSTDGALSAGSYEPLQHVSHDLESILFHDDSNVSIEHQVAEMTRNQLQHNVALAIMASQFRLLQAVISERP
jgi:flagellar basal-body rod protein FlgB